MYELRDEGLSGERENRRWDNADWKGVSRIISGSLSGGQTHLLALAGAVSLQPDVLILDEPIAQLDPMHADRIYEVLRELNEKYGKTIIVIEHHTEYIADYCKTCTAVERRPCTVEASGEGSVGQGGRTSKLQHLSTAGNTGRL